MIADDFISKNSTSHGAWQIECPADPTPGLLASMCQQARPDFLMEKSFGHEFDAGFTPAGRRNYADLMRKVHKAVIAFGRNHKGARVELPRSPSRRCLDVIMTTGNMNEVSAMNVYAEITGQGFYAPEWEDQYAQALK